MNNIKPYKQSKLSIKMNGKPVVQMAFKGKYTKDEIKNFVQQQSDLLKQKNHDGSVQVSIKYPDTWKSGYFTKVGEHVAVYSYMDSNVEADDPDEFSEFRVYVTKN